MVSTHIGSFVRYDEGKELKSGEARRQEISVEKSGLAWTLRAAGRHVRWIREANQERRAGDISYRIVAKYDLSGKIFMKQLGTKYSGRPDCTMGWRGEELVRRSGWSEVARWQEVEDIVKRGALRQNGAEQGWAGRSVSLHPIGKLYAPVLELIGRGGRDVLGRTKLPNSAT